MANKILKTLTIDGVSRDMHDVESYVDSKTVNLVANTATDVASIALTKPGVYLVNADVQFPPVGTASATLHEIGLLGPGGEALIAQKSREPVPADFYASDATFLVLDSSAVPFTATLRARCGQACTGVRAAMRIAKIIDL